MNHRIGNNKVYLLAKEAGLIEFEKFDWNPELVSPTQDSVVKAHKFAELIVKECINTVNKRYMGDNNREDMEVRRCVEDLKKHFGVE